MIVAEKQTRFVENRLLTREKPPWSWRRR